MEDMNSIYEEMLAEQAAMEKVADDTSGDGGEEFGLFTKIAAGDEEAAAQLSEYIDESLAAGRSEDEIAEEIGEAMEAEGLVDGEGDVDSDNLDEAKEAMYVDGFERAIDDVLDKTAGAVTREDLIQFALGHSGGEGYVDGREFAEQVVEKVAGIRERAAGASKYVRGKGARLMELLKGGRIKELKGMSKKKRGNELLKERAKVWSARAGAAGAGGAGLYGAHRGAKAVYGDK